MHFLGRDGGKIRASGKFKITTETIDPYHVLVDVPKDW